MLEAHTLYADDAIKVLMALLVGGLIGAERELRDKPAGLRTIILICVGSTLFTSLSLRIGAAADPARIAAQIVTGVGFLGAGVIMHEGSEVCGLTTASTIWLAAALGMGIGGGHLLFTALVAGIILVVLWVFPVVERRLERAVDARSYEVVSRGGLEKSAQLEALLTACGLRVTRP